MTTLIGSRAAKEHIPDFREPNDIDYFAPFPVGGPKDVRVERFWHPNLSKWDFGDVATLDELYTIKVSHAFWELHGTWSKHMTDLLTFEDHGAIFIPELYDILYPIWEETHGKKKANLEATPEEFFNANVTRIYDHDSIHESVAYYDEPLFNKILRDGSEVAVSRAKFEALPHEDKLKLVREEVYATALERKLIPTNYRENKRVAYHWALMKTVTSFSKGWFPLFIVLNYRELRKPELDFVAKHKVNSHMLRTLTSEG